MARHQAEARATGLVPEVTPDATAGSEAAGGQLVSADPAVAQQAFFQYTIQAGDTIGSIAAGFGVSEDYILWNNPEVSADPNFLLVGEALLIPSVNGIVYHVAYGDTLTDIAGVYQIDVQSILGFVPNGIATPDGLSEGMVLLLPGAVPPPAPIPAAVVAVEEAPVEPTDSGSTLPVPASDPPASSVGFIWPFYGNITTYFGEPRGNSYHKGIDIDGFGNYGAPIAAAASGTVIVAAWDDWGLGYHVKIQHDDGSMTVYGHLSEIWVSPGQYVGQGESVGALGSTGYSTGPHLHFELWIGGGPVDPLGYLP
jgi:murein DD-endopeptidase MepM/ murein hydrolase activator NlpD